MGVSFEHLSVMLYKHLLLVRWQHALLPVQPVASIQQVAGKNAAKLQIELTLGVDLAVPASSHPPVGSAHAWHFEVEEVARRVVVQLRA